MDFIHLRRIFICCLCFMTLKDDIVNGLKCWRCITNNCENAPEDIDQASEEKCHGDQMCQKVEYEMYSTLEQKTYTSTVRSCAFDCQSKDDFIQNCTRELLTTRGCSRRLCCGDEDLCNSSRTGLVICDYIVLAFLTQIISYMLQYVEGGF